MSRLCKLNYASSVNIIIPLIICIKNLNLYKSIYYRFLNKFQVLACILITNYGIIRLTYNWEEI